MIQTISAVSQLGTAKVTVDIVQKGNPEIRPQTAMKPTWITIHNTGNSGRGADADMHNRYIHNLASYSPRDTSHVSWHFSVDDKFIYQHLPLDEMAWHCGDGSRGTGNTKSIGIEICQNPETNTHQAEENAIALVKWLVQNLGISANNVAPHQKWSGKYCPRVILSRDGSFDKFHNRIRTAVSTNTSTAKECGCSKDCHCMVEVTQVSKPVTKPKPKPTTDKGYLTKGDTGSKVKTLQKLLVNAGFKVAIDGSFGPATLAAVKSFQAKYRLSVDGFAGPATMAKLAVVNKPSGIKSVGTIEIANLNNFTYIYAKTSDKSTRLGTAKKGSRYPIAGSVAGWYEIIYKGKRAYVKDKYGKRV